ncbi:MAG: glycosyltransferase family 4 protein [Negativibacillus sp.]|nr:glycosyltransferase family 4 protein [Negativibacillus sp.]
MKKICMIVQDKMVKGGIAAVISGYYGSKLEQDYKVIYVESYKDGGKLTKLLKGIQGYIKFVKVLLVDKPDLIHIHSSFGPSFYRKLPFIYISSWVKKPIINHIHGADFSLFYEHASAKKKRLIKSVYERCSVLIALSDEWKDKLSQIVSENKIVVVENYSILHEDALEERCLRQSNHKILFLGELGRRKGCYDIPDVVEQVVAYIPDAKFILAGAGSVQDEIAIKQMIKEKKVEKNVEFPGWVRGKEKDKLLREADVFFLPSYNEGMPMSILDAMGYGLPIVSTNVGGIPKIVQNGKNGYCVEPGNIIEMSEAIKILIESKRIESSVLSFKIVKNGYSLEQHIKKLEKCYVEALE